MGIEPLLSFRSLLEKLETLWEDFRDGLVSESRPEEKFIPYEQYRATRGKAPTRVVK